MSEASSGVTQISLDRRAALKQLAALAGMSVWQTTSLADETASLDGFGGWKERTFEPTGYFRVAKSDRWWFVTPDGHAFISFGMNHPNEDYISQSYNVEFWKKKFGAEDVNDPAFQKGFVAKVMKDLQRFGMNSLGTHSRKERFTPLTVPYVQGLYFVRTPYWAAPARDRFPDVFSPQFAQRCRLVVRRLVEPVKADPYLLGYTFTDCPILTDADAAAHGQVSYGRAQPDLPTWPRVLRNMGPDEPGKRAWLNCVRERSPSINGFNLRYHTEFKSFEALLKAKDWSPVTPSDRIADQEHNQACLVEILKQYYEVACTAIRSVDRNHLIFGDIINAQTAPPDEVVTTISQYTDLVAFQYYDDYEAHRHLLDRWSRLTGKPLYHADTSFCVAYEEMPHPIGALCQDNEERAQRFYNCARQTLSRPDTIGYNWCGWMDMWAQWKADRQHTGLQDPFGNYHQPMPETMSRFGNQLYGIASQSGI